MTDPNEMPPIPLRAQIEELEYELSMRRSVYARLDRAEPSGKSARDLHMARMQAAKETLEQLMARTNERG
jgi:DNA-nicking Smr family endonuclease